MSHYIQSGLKARRSALLAEAEQLMDKSERIGKMPSSDAARFDAIIADIDKLDGELRLGERKPMRAGIEIPDLSGSSANEKPEVRAFHNFLKHGLAGLGPDDRDMMMGQYRSDPGIRAAQSVGTGSAGGFAVPDEAMRPLVEAMKLVGGVLPYATIVPSQSGADLPIPTDNETAVKGEIITENSQHNEGDITISQVVLQSFLYSSKIVRVSVQLMDDAGFNFGDYVMRKLGERLGRATAEHWVVGDGSSKPRGVSVAATVGKTAASATAVTYDELVDLMHSIDPIYRVSPSAVWVMNDITFSAIRKLKDSQLRPLYGDLSANAPTTLLGRPVAIDNNMPAMTTGNKSILFGDLKSYYVRLVREPRVLRLEERYADFLQLGFLAFLRADGDLVDGGGGAIKALQMA